MNLLDCIIRVYCIFYVSCVFYNFCIQFFQTKNLCNCECFYSVLFINRYGFDDYSITVDVPRQFLTFTTLKEFIM